MASATQTTIRAVLRDGGPLTLDEVVERVQQQRPATTKNPKQTIRNALKNDLICQSAGEGRYVYLPTFVRGAAVCAPMDLVAPAKGLLAVGADLVALLTPLAEPGDRGPAPALALDGGPTVMVTWEGFGWRGMPRSLVKLPAPFWRWWAERQREGATALVVRCEDGEAGRFSVRAIDAEALDRAAVEARNARLHEAARDILKRAQGLWPEDLARRLLAYGVYHGEPTPDPLSTALFTPDAPFYMEHMNVTYRPRLTPALRRLFAPRLRGERDESDNLMRELLGLPLQEPEDAPLPAEDAPLPPAEHLLRLKVSLAWDRKVWRMIESPDDATLEDVHLAIQDAFNWDNDHLYAFYLSGHTRDHMTRVDGPFMDPTGLFGGETDYPAADEVTLAALELRLKQRFLYLFDFGDQLEHDIEVAEILPLPPTGGVEPRVLASQGEAPPQYPTWDGDEEEDDDGDDDNDFYPVGD